MNLAEAHKVIRFPTVNRLMMRKPKIDRGYDIPYVSGISRDALTVFIDKDLPNWPYLGEAVDVTRFMLLREITTRAVYDALTKNDDPKDAQRLMILLNMVAADDKPYLHASEVGNLAEEYAVGLQYKLAGIKAYSSFIQSRCKADDEIHRTPDNLDKLPYTVGEYAYSHDCQLLRYALERTQVKGE